MNCINKIITILVILSIQIQVSEQAKINNRLFGKALARWILKSDWYPDLIVLGSLFDSLNSLWFNIIFSLNDAFTDIQWHDINEKAVRSEIIHIFIHGHSIYDEAAFYELYVTGQITSKQGLDRFIQERVPGFSGKVTKYRFLDRLRSSAKFPHLSRNSNMDS